MCKQDEQRMIEKEQYQKYTNENEWYCDMPIFEIFW